MERKYSVSIGAGVVGGILLSACIIINIIISVLTARVESLAPLGLITCCVWLVMLAVFLATGALAARWAGTEIKSLSDGVVAGAIAGAATGIIGTIMRTIESVITPWLLGQEYYDSLYSLCGSSVPSSSLAEMSLGGLVGGLCCCGPVIIVISIIISIIGAAAYATLVLKVR